MSDRENRRERQIIEDLQTESPSVRQRRALLSELRRVGTEVSIGALRHAVRSTDAQSRVRAVFALAHIGTDEAVDALAECLSMEPGPHLTFAADSLGKLGARRSIPALVHCLEARGADLDQSDKRVIIHALARMPHRSEVPVLSAVLRERNRATRRVAAEALAKIRAPEGTAALEDAAETLSWLQGASVRRALRRTGETRDVSRPHADPALTR